MRRQPLRCAGCMACLAPPPNGETFSGPTPTCIADSTSPHAPCARYLALRQCRVASGRLPAERAMRSPVSCSSSPQHRVSMPIAVELAAVHNASRYQRCRRPQELAGSRRPTPRSPFPLRPAGCLAQDSYGSVVDLATTLNDTSTLAAALGTPGLSNLTAQLSGKQLAALLGRSGRVACSSDWHWRY